MVFDGIILSMIATFNYILGLLEISNSSAVALAGWLTHAYHFISIAGNFFPLEIFAIIIANIIMWLSIHLLISIVRFILDFVPLF